MPSQYKIALFILLAAVAPPAAPHPLAVYRILTANLYSGPVSVLQPGAFSDSTPGQLTRAVDRFYQLYGRTLFWLSADSSARLRRTQLLDAIDSAAWDGLDSLSYHPRELRALAAVLLTPPEAASAAARPVSSLHGSAALVAADRQFTMAALAYLFDLLRGPSSGPGFSFDDVSPRYEDHNYDWLLQRLASISPVVPAANLKTFISDLIPASPPYLTLKEALRYQLDSVHTKRIQYLSHSLNVFRWIHHLRAERFIIVNIPSATLYFFDADTLGLTMKVVLGQPSKRTPRFAAWCSRLVLYPYWNIPHKISVNEFLPLFKKAPGLPRLLEIEVLDEQQRPVPAASIHWSTLNAAHFPYRLRQYPGCTNALGVLKFDLDDPYDVYMHDTNLKSAFSFSSRYLSHGCIRLEFPFALGRRLSNNLLDTTLLSACLKNQKPSVILVDPIVPVFVVYLPAIPNRDKTIGWFKDVYHLFP